MKSRRSNRSWVPLTFVLGLSVPGLASAETCPPLAVVQGSGPDAKALTAALIERGVRVEPDGLPPGTCGAIEVQLSSGDAGLSIAIRDPWGREAVRQVKDPLTAAALVESWARMDLLDGVVTSSRAAAKKEARAPVVAADPAPTAVATPVIEEEATLLFGVRAEGGLGRDRNRWLGGSIAGCGRLGPLCFGGTARYAISQSRQSAVDLLVSLDVPLSAGIFSLTPGFGVGAGWIQDGHDERGSQLERDPQLERGRGPMMMGRDASGIGLRAEAHLVASIALVGGLRLEVGGSASAAPEIDRRLSLGDPGLTIVRGQAGLAWGTP